MSPVTPGEPLPGQHEVVVDGSPQGLYQARCLGCTWTSGRGGDATVRAEAAAHEDATAAAAIPDTLQGIADDPEATPEQRRQALALIEKEAELEAREAELRAAGVPVEYEGE